MKKMKWTLTTLAASLVIMTFAAASQATVLRAFVSSTGNDANIGANCVQATPCKTFAVAIGAVTAGGELIALDTSGYGPLANINKAITIATVPGATAFVVAATGTSAFTVNGAATDFVILRNISFSGSGASSTTGVLLNSGKLVGDRCQFTQLTSGLRGVGGTIVATHSSFTGNTGRGVYVSGSAHADLTEVLITDNATGITADGNCATVFVRLESGSVLKNTLGFEMLNGVCAPSSGNVAQNIFLRNDVGRLNIVGNTTAVGPSDGTPGHQAALGTYSIVISTTF